MRLASNFCSTCYGQPRFFGLRSPLAGMVLILFLFVAILWMIVAFHGISPAAAYLQIPYALWVAFASVLNLSLVILNR